MSLPSVGWSKCCEMGMIGGMKQSSFQSSVTMICFYFAEERALLSSSWYHRTLATRNFLLPSPVGIETSFFILVIHAVASVGMAFTARSGLKRYPDKGVNV